MYTFISYAACICFNLGRNPQKPVGVFSAQGPLATVVLFSHVQYLCPENCPFFRTYPFRLESKIKIEMAFGILSIRSTFNICLLKRLLYTSVLYLYMI